MYIFVYEYICVCLYTHVYIKYAEEFNSGYL